LADLASLFFLLLVGYSIYVLCRQNSVNIWLFIVTLIGTTAIALMLPDLIFGGIRSASNRYLIPSFLGIQVAVAYLLATQITKNSLLQRKIWQIITVVLLSVGVVSCAIISQSQTSWIKVVSYNLPQYASIINQANRPILISNDFGINFGQIFALSYLLEPKVKLQLVVDSTIPNIPEGVGDVFILNPSNSLKQGIEKEYKSKVESVYKDEHNWLGKLSQN
jgi:uncharacterized membrane protein